MRISNPQLSLREREALERLQREEEQEQMKIYVAFRTDGDAVEKTTNGTMSRFSRE